MVVALSWNQLATLIRSLTHSAGEKAIPLVLVLIGHRFPRMPIDVGMLWLEYIDRGLACRNHFCYGTQLGSYPRLLLGSHYALLSSWLWFIRATI